MSVVILSNEMVHYEVLGRGRPILFLHGWVGSWRYWIPSMQGVAINSRAYALDFWGFGDSAKAQARYTLDEQVSLISQFVEQMGIMRMAVVGHGLGAVVGMLYATRYPEVVDRLLAITIPMSETTISPRFRSNSPAELADWLLTRLPATEPARTDAPKCDARAIQASLESLQSMGIHDLINALPTACLMVHGQNDPAVQPPALDDLAALPEHTHSVLFDQSGHFPMLDETNKFNRLMVDFFALPSGENPRQLQLKEEWKRRVR
ncbi:MAG TPA: alpha/beta hydrolase [Anaerolineaceae bacterium]|nr:alpha/beta hydrolase [Anaerolineaceae bacterium]HPN50347.1 alpha/beta hydrolase [Anaerolineaceae bacterium]